MIELQYYISNIPELPDLWNCWQWEYIYHLEY